MTQIDSERPKGVAVISGIAPGLGASLYATFSDAGYQVAGIARSDRIAERIGTQDDYTHFQCDLGKPDDVAATIDAIQDDLGRISVLICNAHQLLIRSFAETSLEDFENVWRNTCFGAVTAAHTVVPQMQEQGGGTVILSGATASIRGGGAFSAFASAKFALRGFAQALAREYAPKGVHVIHVVLDGLIWEEQTRERFDPPEEKCISPDAIARTYLQLVQQDRSAWTHELDMRPFGEAF